MATAAIASIKPQDGAVLPIGELMERILTVGDISQLAPGDRAHYLIRVCDSIGLNPLSRPFDLIPGPGGSLKLYANKGATDQLRKMYGLRATTRSANVINDIYIVEVEVNRGNRSEANIGAVSIKGLQGEALANAMMKAHTKAKRRATLDYVGLGFLDPEIPRDYEPYDPFADEGDGVDGAEGIEAHHRPAPEPTPISAAVAAPDVPNADHETGEIKNGPMSEKQMLQQTLREVASLARRAGLDKDGLAEVARSLGLPVGGYTLHQAQHLRADLQQFIKQNQAAQDAAAARQAAAELDTAVGEDASLPDPSDFIDEADL